MKTSGIISAVGQSPVERGIKFREGELEKIQTGVAERSQPKVSVGLPVYNGATCIRRALDSLLAQTFTDFELIISDNASTDGTDAICRAYSTRDVRIKYLRQAENLGPRANFEFLLDTAVGEYFLFAPHDDYWHEGYLSAAVEALDKDTGAALALGKIEYLDEKDEVFMIDQPPYLLNDDVECRIRTYITTAYTDYMMYGVFRATAIRGFRFATDGVAAEREFILSALLQGRVADAPGMLYRNCCSFKTPVQVLQLFGLRSWFWGDIRDHLRCMKRLRKHFGWSMGLRLVLLYMIYRFPLIPRLGRYHIRPAPGRRFLRQPTTT